MDNLLMHWLSGLMKIFFLDDSPPFLHNIGVDDPISAMVIL